MKKYNKIISSIGIDVIKDYIKIINSAKESKNNKEKEVICIMVQQFENMKAKYSNEKRGVYTTIIKEIMKYNNGYIEPKFIKPLNISRHYFSILEKRKEIEKVKRGIYITPNIIEDEFYTFQQKYKKIIYSHMNALYFHELTQEIPYKYTVTIPNGYHVFKINENNNIFYVNKDIYNLGIIEIDSPMGNKIKIYDIERCICDIIRSKNRMDIEHIKYSVKEYLKRKDKDLVKLTYYAEKMGIRNRVMDFISMMYE